MLLCYNGSAKDWRCLILKQEGCDTFIGGRFRPPSPPVSFAKKLVDDTKAREVMPCRDAATTLLAVLDSVPPIREPLFMRQMI